MNIFERDRSGAVIPLSDPEYHLIDVVIMEAQRLIAQLNAGYHDPAEVRRLFGTLTGRAVDESFWLLPPFYTDFGRNIVVGKDVFVNHGCEFMDRGGITIGDRVLFAPRVSLITTEHPLDPVTRRSTISRPIVIKDNAWLGAGSSVMPGVTIGENSVVAAHAVVTKNVPDNVVVGGIPAKVIKKISAT